MKKNNPIAIGLEIGSHAVKCVAVNAHRDEFRLEFAEAVKVSAEGSAPVVAELVKKAQSTVAGLVPNIRVSLSGSSVLIRRIKLPVMTRQELAGAIRFQAEERIPFSVDDSILDFQILDENSSDGSMNVLLVAAKRDFVLEQLKELESAAVTPQVLDSEILCMSNVFEALGPAVSEKTYGLLNIGHRVSSFAIFHDGSLHFTREILHGGHELNQAIAELKGIDEGAAEALKQDAAQMSSAELKPAIHAGLEPLCADIEQSMGFFQSEFGAELKEVYLSGGGAMAPGVAEGLAETFGCRFSGWDVSGKLKLGSGVNASSFKADQMRFAIALGAAVR